MFIWSQWCAWSSGFRPKVATAPSFLVVKPRVQVAKCDYAPGFFEDKCLWQGASHGWPLILLAWTTWNVTTRGRKSNSTLVEQTDIKWDIVSVAFSLRCQLLKLVKQQKKPAADWDKCKIGPRNFGNFKPGKKGHRVCSEDVASDVLFLFPNWPGFFICFCSRNNSKLFRATVKPCIDFHLLLSLLITNTLTSTWIFDFLFVTESTKSAYETINRTYTGLAVVSLVGFVLLLLTLLAKVKLEILVRCKMVLWRFSFHVFPPLPLRRNQNMLELSRKLCRPHDMWNWFYYPGQKNWDSHVSQT